MFSKLKQGKNVVPIFIDHAPLLFKDVDLSIKILGDDPITKHPRELFKNKHQYLQGICRSL